MTDRAEHLQWAKDRALAYSDSGDLNGAFASMASDLGKHDELAGHAGLEIGLLQMLGGLIRTPAQMRDFIEGFN